MSPHVQGRLLSHRGRQAWVADPNGDEHLCLYKGRELQPTANDRVLVDLRTRPGVILEILPRANCLMRSEAHRTKSLAANVDLAMVVISGSPPFSDELLARMICAATAEQIPGLLVLNKSDLTEPTAQARQNLRIFDAALQSLGWSVIMTNTQHQAVGNVASPDATTADGLQELRHHLHQKTTVVMGQSGMGKSSLLNALIPGFNAQTREISEALQTGKHTTTAGQMVALDAQSWLIDTPGFQLFGLHHLSDTQLALGFPEFAETQASLGRCRFANCRHLNEPGCKVHEGVALGNISERRLALWQSLLESIESTRF